MEDTLTRDLQAGRVDGAYRQMRAIAAGLLRHEFRPHLLTPTVLVHEAFVRRLAGKKLQVASRQHFYGIVANAMRQTLIDVARGRRAAKRNRNAADQWNTQAPGLFSPEEILTLGSALEELKKLDPRAFRVVELRYLLGYSLEEAARILDCDTWKVKEDWDFARVWLRDRIDKRTGLRS